ncbi:hypothetical protein Tco_0665988 [Tanacetum coccineum]
MSDSSNYSNTFDLDDIEDIDLVMQLINEDQQAGESSRRSRKAINHERDVAKACPLVTPPPYLSIPTVTPPPLHLSSTTITLRLVTKISNMDKNKPKRTKPKHEIGRVQKIKAKGEQQQVHVVCAWVLDLYYGVHGFDSFTGVITTFDPTEFEIQRDYIRLKLGNGENTRFWVDNWYEGGVIKELFQYVAPGVEI